MAEDSDPGGGGPPRRAIRLKWWQRLVFGIVGFGVTGFAGWMVYRPDDDGAAVTAFVVGGFVAGLLAVVGRVPTQLKVGDSEAQFYEDESLMSSRMR